MEQADGLNATRPQPVATFSFSCNFEMIVCRAILRRHQSTAANSIKRPQTKLTVLGVGGAGGSIVARMQAMHGARVAPHVAFVVANTDAQALSQHDADAIRLVQLGSTGLGAGTDPAVGAEAATESVAAVMDAIGETNLVFLAAGMGGGTGTGAAPVLARALRAAGVPTVALATLPFEYEGVHRARVAFGGVAALGAAVDALVLLPNQRLLALGDASDLAFVDAFRLLDAVVFDGVQSISDLMVRPSLVNLDFADVRTVLQAGGLALLATGHARGGEQRAHDAATAALQHPLWRSLDVGHAKAALVSVVGDHSLSLNDVRTVANIVTAAVAPDANVVVGTAIDDTLGDELRVSLVITGIPMGSNNAAAVDEAALLENVRASSKAASPFQSLLDAVKKWW